MLKVAELVTSEFFEQGDRERAELKLTPAVSKKDQSAAHHAVHRIHFQYYFTRWNDMIHP